MLRATREYEKVSGVVSARGGGRDVHTSERIGSYHSNRGGRGLHSGEREACELLDQRMFEG
jgi:hypothetical protein